MSLEKKTINNLFMKQKYFFKLCAIAFMFMFPSGTMAQTVKGKITDSSTEGLPFVSIVEKGTTNRTISNDSGEFSITVSSLPSTFIVSSKGYATQTIGATSTSYLSVVVKEEKATYFTTGRILFMLFFLINFVILAIYSYRKDLKSHKAHYKSAAKKLAIYGSIILIIFISIRLFTGHS